MNILAPSLLAANFANLEKELSDIKEGGAKYLHIDVMDGSFVPSISFGMPVIESIRKITDLVFDVHLMIDSPERYIDEFAKCGADIITVHAESTKHLSRVIQAIKEKGVKVGVSVNPATPLSVLDIDMVLIMSVNPGFGGQKYISNITGKIQALRKTLDEKGLNVDIEVDGGVKVQNVEEVLGAGANVIVAGSAVFGDATLENTKAFMQILNKG